MSATPCETARAVWAASCAGSVWNVAASYSSRSRSMPRVGDAKHVHVRAGGFVRPVQLVDHHFGDQCGTAGADGGAAVAQDPYALLVVPVVQNHFQQVQVGVGDRLEEVTCVDRKPFGQSKFRRFAPRTLDGAGDQVPGRAARGWPASIPERSRRRLRRYRPLASDHVLQTVDLQRDLVSVSTASGARRDVGFLTSSHDDGGQVCLTKRFNSSDPG